MDPSSNVPPQPEQQQFSLVNLLMGLAQIGGLALGIAYGFRHRGWLGALGWGLGGVAIGTAGCLLLVIALGGLIFLFGEDELFLPQNPDPNSAEAPCELSRSFRRNRAILRGLFFLVLIALVLWLVRSRLF